MNLTLLDGIKLTPLQRKLYNHLSFQYLRYEIEGYPYNWGELLTGKHVTYSAYQQDTLGMSNYTFTYETLDTPRLSPHAAGIETDKVREHERALRILAATIIRDAKSEHDLALADDLGLWLSGHACFQGFYWERQLDFQQRHAAEKVRQARIAELKKGKANVLVLLCTRLLPDEREELRETLIEGCIERGLFQKGNSHERLQHFPMIRCKTCAGHTDQDCCRNMIILVDCGNVKTVLAKVSRKIQKPLAIARFSIPRSTFVKGHSKEGNILPRFMVYGLDTLDQPGQRESISMLQDWLSSERIDERRHSGKAILDYRSSQFILPLSRKRINAVIFAGPAVYEDAEPFRKADQEGGSRKSKEKGISIAFVGGWRRF